MSRSKRCSPEASSRGSLGGLPRAALILAALTACDPAPAVDAEPGEPPADIIRSADSLYGTPAPRNLRVTPVEIEVPGLPTAWHEARVAVIADPYLGAWEDSERVAAEAARRAGEANVDLVVLLGSLVAAGDDAGPLAGLLDGLGGTPVVAVPRAGDTELDDAVAELLAERGVPVLRNEGMGIERNGDALRIAAIEEGFSGQPDWRRAQIVRAALDEESPVHLLFTPDPTAATLLPEDAFRAILAGGVACGEAGIPDRPSLTELEEGPLADYRLDGAERAYWVGGHTLFITCGIGHTFLPTRLAGPAEMAVVTLRPGR